MELIEFNINEDFRKSNPIYATLICILEMINAYITFVKDITERRKSDLELEALPSLLDTKIYNYIESVKTEGKYIVFENENAIEEWAISSQKALQDALFEKERIRNFSSDRSRLTELKGLCGNTYTILNNDLRINYYDIFHDPDIQRMNLNSIHKIDQIIDYFILKDPMITFRMITIGGMEYLFNKSFEKIGVDDQAIEKAFMHTTLNPMYRHLDPEEVHCVMLIIRVAKGIKGIYRSLEFGHEEELVIQRGCSIRIKNVMSKGLIYGIYECDLFIDPKHDQYTLDSKRQQDLKRHWDIF